MQTFQPMATCARAVIAHNGCTDKIHLIPKMSTNITVGPEGDMTHRANILVTEVFDTELIGEGAIGTFNHANQHLLTVQFLFTRSHATIFWPYLIYLPIISFVGRLCCYTRARSNFRSVSRV